MAIESLNPATGEVLETFREIGREDVERMLATAHAAFLEWRDTRYVARVKNMRQAATILRTRKLDYARLMTLEMGKPIVQGEAEIEKCAWTCEYYADHAEALLAEQPRQTDASRSYVRFDPLGVVLAVMPWNFPFWQVFRFAAPALMAGNAAVLKHASNVPRCALTIEEIFRDAGFPRGLFATALVGSSAVPALIADRRVAAVTLTGSDHAGSQVAQHPGGGAGTRPSGAEAQAATARAAGPRSAAPAAGVAGEARRARAPASVRSGVPRAAGAGQRRSPMGQAGGGGTNRGWERQVTAVI